MAISNSDAVQLSKLGRVLAKTIEVVELIDGFEALKKRYEDDIAALKLSLANLNAETEKVKADIVTATTEAAKLRDDAKAEFEKQKAAGKAAADAVIEAAKAEVTKIKADEKRINDQIKQGELEVAKVNARISKALDDEKALQARIADQREAARKALGL